MACVASNSTAFANVSGFARTDKTGAHNAKVGKINTGILQVAQPVWCLVFIMPFSIILKSFLCKACFICYVGLVSVSVINKNISEAEQLINKKPFKDSMPAINLKCPVG